MRVLGFGLAIALLVVAAGSGIAQILSYFASSSFQPISLGSMWFSLHGNSLVGFQALIEKSVSPAVWPPIQWLLTVPAWIALAVPGILLFFLCRPRDRGLRSMR